MIKVNLKTMLPVLQDELEATLNRVSTAITYAAGEVAKEWRKEIDQAQNLSRTEKEAYFHSIQTQKTGPYTAEIWSDYHLADEIENGRPARDLKKMLQTSKKTRLSTKGNKYLIIPFRHNTPGNTAHAAAMPANVYDVAKKMSPSLVLAPGTKKSATRLSASGHQVAQHSYHWGGRLPAGTLGPNPQGKTDIHAGMVKMNTSSGKQKSSAYLTFRTMSEKSSGWIVPAKPGLQIVKKVEERMEPVIKDLIKEAINWKNGS
jgi:hypothetical protein